MMKPYEFAEMGCKDLYCEECGRIISTSQYIENDSLCDNCVKENENEECKEDVD